MTLVTAKWTIDEYHRMIEAGILDDHNVELLKGEIVEMVPEGEFHAYSSDEAGEYVAGLLGDRAFWLIEYSESSLSKDLEIKSRVYAEVGIREYWVVNLKRRWLIVFRDPQEGEYTSKTTLTTGVIQPLAFPDLDVSVDRIING